jgi:hypothetical protein
MKTRVKIGLILSLLLFLSQACSLFSAPAVPAQPPVNTPAEAPTAPPAHTEATPQGSQPNAYFDGVSFTYQPSLAAGVNAQAIETNSPSGPDLPFFSVHPNEVVFDFQGFVNPGGVKPVLMVFNVAEYEGLAAADYPDNNPVTEQVDALKKILAARPADSSGHLPFLMPDWNAAESFHAHLKYLDFQNGSGIRYLAQYGQGPDALSNELLFYTFQGITKDGKWYVSAVLPVSHAPLPGDDGLAQIEQDYSKFMENFPAYRVNIQNKLNAEADNTFTPDLAVYDALSASLKIDR